MKRRSHPVISTGFSSILVVFIIISLVTFAMLSLVTANSDKKLSAQITASTDDYYAASNKAEEILSEIDSVLYRCFSSSSDSREYFDSVKQEFEQNESTIETIYDENDTLSSLSYTVPISEAQSLYVIIDILYPASQGDACYTPSSWQIVESSEWEPDTSLPVFGN